MESAIWGLLGAIVGASASIAAAWLAARSSYEVQRAKASDERAERANAFQRQTLLDLQEAIHDALRLVARAHIEDTDAHGATKEWGKNMLSDEVNEGVRVAQRRVAILIERVADDQLRASVKALMETAAGALLARSAREANFHMEAISKETEQVFGGIGTVLRRHLE